MDGWAGMRGASAGMAAAMAAAGRNGRSGRSGRNGRSGSKQQHHAGRGYSACDEIQRRFAWRAWSARAETTGVGEDPAMLRGHGSAVAVASTACLPACLSAIHDEGACA